MSFDPVLWAMKDAPVVDVEEWAVLVCMAEHADDDGCTAMPSQPNIAARTKLSKPTVKRRIDSLDERGLISRGDQRAAERYPADKRPIVWDLMIPFSWFPNIDRIQEYRAGKGRPPLRAEDRPSMSPPPPKRRRADFGVTKSDGSTRAGGLEEPRLSESGGSCSSERGVSEVGAGGLEDPQPSPLTLLENPPNFGAVAPPKQRRPRKAQPVGADPLLEQSKSITIAYLDWRKIQKGGPVLKEREAFWAISKNLVLPALRDGHSELHIKNCLCDAANRGHEWPSDSMWRQLLDNEISKARSEPRHQSDGFRTGIAHAKRLIDEEQAETQRQHQLALLQGDVG